MPKPNMTNMTNIPHTNAQVEHIRKEFYKNSFLAAHGLNVALTAIADAEYHLAQLAQIEADNGFDFGMLARFADSLEEYHLRVCEVEHALNALLYSLSDYVDSRSREYRVK